MRNTAEEPSIQPEEGEVCHDPLRKLQTGFIAVHTVKFLQKCLVCFLHSRVFFQGYHKKNYGL